MPWHQPPRVAASFILMIAHERSARAGL